MKVHLSRLLIIACASSMILGQSNASAQKPVGRIEKITDHTGRIAREVEVSTEAVVIKRGRHPISCAPDTLCFKGDEIRIEKQHWFVALSIQDCQVVPSTHIDPDIVKVMNTVFRFGSGDWANICRIVDDGGGGIMFKVDRGAGVLACDRQLAATLAGTRFRLSSRALYATNKAGDEGFLFLESGEINFPDHPQIRVKPNTGVHLVLGAPPVSVLPSEEDAALLSEVIDDHLPQGLSSTAAFVGLAVVGVGGIIAIVSSSGDDGPAPPQFFSGTITVTFPR